MIKNCEKIWNFWIFLVLICYSKFLFKNQYFSLRSFRHYTLIIRYQTKIIYYEYNLKLLIVFLIHYFFWNLFCSVCNFNFKMWNDLVIYWLKTPLTIFRVYARWKATEKHFKSICHVKFFSYFKNMANFEAF